MGGLDSPNLYSLTLLITRLHRFKASIGQRVGTLERFLDEKILSRQLLECRFVFLQVGAEETEHFSRGYQVLPECSQG